MKEKNYGYLFRYIKLMLKMGKFYILISFLGLVLINTISIILPEIIQNVVDDGIIEGNSSSLIELSFLYFGLVIVSKFLEVGLDNYYETLKLRVSTKLKKDLFQRLENANGKYISNKETGNLLRILDNDIFQVEDFGIEILLNIIINSITAIVVFIILLRLNIILLVIVFMVQIIIFGVQTLFSRKITYYIREVREIAGKQSNMQEQFIGNLKNAILSNATGYFQKSFDEKQKNFVNISKKVNLFISIQSAFASTLNSFTTIITYLIGGILIINNRMSLGELIAFLQYISLLIAPCMFFVSSNIKIRQTNIALEKIYKELDNISQNKNIESSSAYISAINEINFKDIQFSYTNQIVIKNLNLCLKKDEMVAIVGESGCGKSTLLNLLYRLWEPEKGKILVNNLELKTFDINIIRSKICIVSQDILMFNHDIWDNIEMGKAEINKNNLIKICSAVGLNELIDTEGGNSIGENGMKLSGGQKQRIAIARALLKESDVLIFDEATSALDNISQKKTMENIKPYFKNKIVIIIAHRLEAIKFVDKIVVMKEGQIIECGKHEDLLKSKGYYYRMLISA